jgi:mono/diheme cytochrome c family protein
MTLRLQILTGLCLGLLASCGRQASDDGKLGSASPEAASALPEKVTFNAHIRPIFSDTCFACHGFDAKTREADLRLDTPEGAFAKLKDSDIHAIIPGKPDESAILARMFSDDADEVMPPPDFH